MLCTQFNLVYSRTCNEIASVVFPALCGRFKATCQYQWYILYKNRIVNIFLYFSCRYSDEQDFWLCYTCELCISFCFMAVIQYMWYFYLSIKFIVELCVFILSESFALLSSKPTRKEQDLIAKYRVIKLSFEMKIMYLNNFLTFEIISNNSFIPQCFAIWGLVLF